MKKLIYLLIILALIFGGYYVWQQNAQVPVISSVVTSTVQSHDSNDVGIVVAHPQPGELVTLPITVEGYINGNGWYANEGEIGSIQVFDGNGKVVSNAVVLPATSDWLKQPTYFKGIVGDRESMSHITTSTGSIKITSGSEKDGEIKGLFSVPVRFK